jgi:hypothetical protein
LHDDDDDDDDDNNNKVIIIIILQLHITRGKITRMPLKGKWDGIYLRSKVMIYSYVNDRKADFKTIMCGIN